MTQIMEEISNSITVPTILAAIGWVIFKLPDAIMKWAKMRTGIVNEAIEHDKAVNVHASIPRRSQTSFKTSRASRVMMVAGLAAIGSLGLISGPVTVVAIVIGSAGTVLMVVGCILMFAELFVEILVKMHASLYSSTTEAMNRFIQILELKAVQIRMPSEADEE